MKNLWQNFNIFGWGLIGATLVLQPTVAQAQYIQRSFLNPSFELPAFGTSCYIQVDEGFIDGWTTNHSSMQGTRTCPVGIYGQAGKIIEIWTTGFDGGNGATSTATNAGNQFAELNAEENASLYQQICLLNNETISFSLLHRGRSKPDVGDVAEFFIGGNSFGRFTTSNNGSVRSQSVVGSNTTLNSLSIAGSGWVQYSGSVTYTGTSSNQNVGFKAISTASGNITVGNFLDQVQFAGKPVVEFTASSGGAAESETTPTTNPPKLRIVGLVPSGGISVPISVSGTAVRGKDYNTTSGTSTFNLNIPAGNYDGSDATSVFTIPFTVINDNISQGVRTIVFTIQTSTSFFASSTTTCGGSPTIASSYTIYDDDFLSGKVWNDADNSANNTFTNINTGSEIGTNAGGLLNAILVDSNNKVLKTTTVAADGTYTFLDVPLNQSNVKILLSTTAGTVGNTAPTASLPANWVNTSPLTTAAFNTGTSISSKDFGIKRQTINVSGTVFSDADADVTINDSDAGTNALSANLTIYAVDTTGKVLDKATVAANGTYSLVNVLANSSVTLRLSNDSTVAIGATAPTASSIPSGWYYTGENKNGTVDGTITTLGNIALTTTTSNLTSQNFGIRQAYTITADTAPTTCNPDYTTALNTGITAAGGQLAVGANDLNWTVEWIAGPASGPGTPYAPPRPVGTMPAVVVGNLAPGAWISEPANAHWISYPFRLSVNSNGYHDDADLDGTRGEGNTSFSGPGTSDDVRLKFTSLLTLPSNANTISISLPVGVAIDNQFVSIKVNGVENLVPTPAANPIAADYGTTKNVNITNGWQAGVNTIEIVVDSGPDRVGFFLAIQGTTTQVCTNPNVLLVKRITAINGDRTKNPNDNTPLNTFVDDTTSTRKADDNSPNWRANYLLGAIDAGKIKPGDEIEYTIYFLNAGSANANTVKICDRISDNQDFKVGVYDTNKDKDVELQLGTSTVIYLTSALDAGDRAQLMSADGSFLANCNLKAANNNGTLVIDVTGNTGVPTLTTMPGSTGQGSPNNSYGYFRFRTKVKP